MQQVWDELWAQVWATERSLWTLEGGAPKRAAERVTPGGLSAVEQQQSAAAAAAAEAASAIGALSGQAALLPWPLPSVSRRDRGAPRANFVNQLESP